MAEVFVVMVGVPAVFFGVWISQRLGAARSVAAVLALAVVAVEELHASARTATQGAEEAPPLIALGWQLHAPAAAGLSVLVVAALAGGLLLAALRGDRPKPAVYLMLAGALACGVVLAGLYEGSAASVLKAAKPALLIIAGLLIGSHLRDAPHRPLAGVLFAVMSLKAAAAVLVTQGYGDRGFRFVLYYDSVTPTLAAAVLLALLVRRRWDRLTVGLAFAAGVVLLLSPRRTPLLAMVVAAVIIVVTARPGRVRRRAVAVAVAVALLVPFAWLLPEDLRMRVDSGIGVLTGAEHEDSAAGHFGDIYRGFDLAAHGPFFGVGPTASQPTGLAAKRASVLYIHNEFLHTWVGLGVIAGLALLVLVLALTVRAVRAARSAGEASLVETIAACLLLAVPAVLMFFPYLSTTTRWPLLYGMAAAVTAGALKRSAEPVLPAPQVPAPAR